MTNNIETLQEMAAVINRQMPNFKIKMILPREDDLDSGDYVVFFDDEDGSKEKEYQDGYASNYAYIFKKSDKAWGFTYSVYYPGVWMYKDGSGEPSSVEFHDSPVISIDINECVKSILQFKVGEDFNDVMEYLHEKYMDMLEEKSKSQ